VVARIHPTAIIEPGAQLGETVSVDAYSIVRAQVTIGEGTTIGPHCVIEGRTTIGRDNRIFQFASIGAISQDMSYAGEPAALEIGDRNTIREFCTLNLGTAKEDGVTRVGSDNWIMAYAHIAHDCRVGDRIVMANNATLAGHVRVGDWAVIGGLTGVHQFVHIGAHAMIGFQGHVAQDVPPYMTADGNPLALRAVNLTGLRRRGFGNERLGVIRQMHKLIYRDSLQLDQAVAAITAMRGSVPEADADIEAMLTFLSQSTRGIVR
jgi:UDP-N-acetylglucosamine acyltransferase